MDVGGSSSSRLSNVQVSSWGNAVEIAVFVSLDMTRPTPFCWKKSFAFDFRGGFHVFFFFVCDRAH